MPKTITPTRTVTAKALDAELGRRANNRKRVAKGEPKVKAAAFYLPSLSREDVAAIKDGGVVKLEFASGRIEHVGLKTNA